VFEFRWTIQASADYETLKHDAAMSGRSAKKGKKKSSRQQGTFRQVCKTLDFLRQNPRHPSLAIHEYESLENPYDAKEKVFEAYEQNNTPGAYRVFWCYGPGPKQITILAITPHP
jgi:hypothetical protein